MDRAEFLNRLEAQLLDVPQAEREEALQYYEDYLNDAGDAGDFDILQELGTPEEVAASPDSYTGSFLADLLEAPAPQKRASRRKKVSA